MGLFEAAIRTVLGMSVGSKLAWMHSNVEWWNQHTDSRSTAFNFSQLLTCGVSRTGSGSGAPLKGLSSGRLFLYTQHRVQPFTSALLNLTWDNNVHSNDPFVPSAHSTQLLCLRPTVLSHNYYYLIELKGLQISRKVHHTVMVFAAFAIGMVWVCYKLTWLQDISIRCIP